MFLMDEKPVFKSVSLSEEFALISFIVLLLGALIIGWWVAWNIERGVIQQTALTTMKFQDSFVSRLIGELSKTDHLNQDSIALLENFDQNSPVGRQIAYFNIWGKDGRLVYSSDLSQIGKVLPPRIEITNAWRDQVSWDMVDPKELEYTVLDKKKGDLIVIFSPIHQARSDRILAVAEIYLYTEALQSLIFRSQVQSWELVIVISLTMFLLLYLLVRRGSRTIEAQQQMMKLQLKQLSELLYRNNALHESVKMASNRTTEINESFLRRISAEIHDGPAQALGYALLRLDTIFAECRKQMTNKSAETMILNERENLRTVLADALEEIRNMAAGMAMPVLDDLDLKQVVQRVINIHESRSKTKVDLDIKILNNEIQIPLKIGLYRLIQEALTNAYHHGKGINQRVQLRTHNEDLVVQISDDGPGFDTSNHDFQEHHLGLVGMKERVLALSGHFEIRSSPGSGTKVIARFPILSGDKYD